MDKTVGIEDLREDVPESAEMKGFWENVPYTDGEYIIVPRVEGV